MRRKGFTLVELLVVVAIIVILAGILYPVFAATRRAAYKATCLSNLKQVGLAVQMYAQDYDETFPTACCQTDVVFRKAQPDYPTQTAYLWTLVTPYIKNAQLWRCPGDTGFTLQGGKIKFTPTAFAQTGSSYNYNTDLAWQHTGDPETDPFETIGQWAPFTIGSVPYPSYTFIAGEPGGHWHNSTTGASVTYHHNMVMAAGHAKSFTRKQLERLADVRNPLWNPKDFGWE